MSWILVPCDEIQDNVPFKSTRNTVTTQSSTVCYVMRSYVAISIVRSEEQNLEFHETIQQDQLSIVRAILVLTLEDT